MNPKQQHIKLSATSFSKILQLKGVLKKYQQGEVLFKEGIEPKSIFLIIKGVVALVKSGAECNVNIMNHKEKDIVGLDLIFDNKLCSYTAVTSSNCEIYEINIDVFKQFLIDENSMSLELLKYLSSLIKQLENSPLYVLN